MTIKLLIIDDQPDFATSIAQFLRDDAPSVSIRGVGRERPCLDALQIVKTEGIAQMFFLIDLHLPDHTGVLSEKGGAIFAEHLLEQHATAPGLADRIVLYSNHDVNGIKLAADIGVRFVRKLDVGDFLRLELSRLLSKPDQGNPEHQSQARLRRQDRDARWFSRAAEAYRRDAGQIAAVYQERVWGIGANVESALRAARRTHSNCPGADELVFLAIPDHVYFDDRGRQIEVLDLQEEAGTGPGHRPPAKRDDPC